MRRPLTLSSLYWMWYITNKYQMLIWKVRFPLYAFLLLSIYIALSLSWYIIFSFRWYPCDSIKYLDHIRCYISLSATINSDSFEILVFSLCVVDSECTAHWPMVIIALVSIFISFFYEKCYINIPYHWSTIIHTPSIKDSPSVP